MSEGTIVRIVGPVVDVDFSEAKKVPKIYDALLFVEKTTAARPLPKSSSGP